MPLKIFDFRLTTFLICSKVVFVFRYITFVSDVFLSYSNQIIYVSLLLLPGSAWLLRCSHLHNAGRPGSSSSHRLDWSRRKSLLHDLHCV